MLSYFKKKSQERELIRAVENGNKELCEELIKKGIDVNVQDKDGNTLLMIAYKKEKGEIYNMLIRNGAFINIKNNEGEKIIDIIKKRKEEEKREVEEAFKKRDIDRWEKLVKKVEYKE